jgi:alkylation response protein AidB-like acyl-CoA dehydrogenase
MADFVLTEEQEEIARASRVFVRERLPVAHLRKLRDTRQSLSREIWKDAAQLGWAGMLIDELHGGAGLGMAEVGVVMEELGRTLAPTPMLSTAVLSATVLAAFGDAALLQRVGAGDAIVAVAFEESDRFSDDRGAARITGGKVTADKRFVLDAPAADLFVIATRDGLALVERGALTVEPRALVDSRGVGAVRCEGAAARVVADDGVLARAIARATVALAAEMLGGIEEAFARTIEYLKQRKQFGVPIGSFQALKHRAAQMFCEIELTRSVVRAALVALDRGSADAPALVSAAKARAGDTFVLVSAEAIQMHGGIGVTDELDIGFYYKRARVAEQTFGTASFHRERFARLSGF